MRSAILNFNVSSAVAIRRSTYKIQKKKSIYFIRTFQQLLIYKQRVCIQLK